MESRGEQVDEIPVPKVLVLEYGQFIWQLMNCLKVRGI